MANFTDFDALAAEPSVALAFLDNAADLNRADVLILPGTKQTMADLDWLASNGFLSKIKEYSGQSRPIIGLCGGFQMLGLKLSDPRGIENNGVCAERLGLGLLSVDTVLGTEKTTRPVSGETYITDRAFGLWRSRNFEGYEIHMGETSRSIGTEPFAVLRALDGTQFVDGATSPSGRVFGTYVHGIFDNDPFRHSFLDWARTSVNLAPSENKAFVAAEREQRLNRWADCLRRSLQLDLIRNWILPAASPVSNS